MPFTSTEFIEPATSRALNAARIEVVKGSVTQAQSQAFETIIIVLEGAWRFRLEESEITLKKDEVLRLAAHERYSAEALSDVIALKIATTSHHKTHPLALPHDDPDQYLWGV